MGTTRKAAVGLFVLGGLALFGLGLFLIGDRKRLFEESFTVYAEFEKLAGLQDGAQVRVSGLYAGEVLSISYPQSPEARFRVRMRVIEDLHGLVRTDSVATIQTEGLVGNMLVDIGEGSEQAPRAPDEGTVQSREPFEIADLMVKTSEVADTLSTTIVSVGGELTTAVQQIQVAVNRADGILSAAGDDVVEMTRAGRSVAQDVESLVADVRAGKGTVGKLMNDEALHQRIEQIATKLNEVSEEAELTIENIREVSDEAKAAIEDIRSEDEGSPGILANLSQTLASANEAASDLAENTESMKRSFLFRGIFLDRGFFDLDSLTPQEYAKGALRGDHLERRFWIGAEDLTETNDAGKEVLSASGIARIRSAMSEILRYPPDSPLIVEGYAGSGPIDEKYLKARRWAFLAREFIVHEYHRSPNYTGFIALEGMSPRDLADDGDREELGESGVVLALYYDEEVALTPRHRVIH